MKVYRIENQETQHGMWYRSDGTYDPFILKLTEGISRDLPMGFDPRYKESGLSWVSAGISKEQMNNWFSPLDALELTQNGYKLFEFQVSTFKKEEHQVLFTRESIINQKEIQLDTIWNINTLIR